MALKLIKTKNAAFAVDEVQDDVREKMCILFGRAIHLYAKRVPTAANPKGVMQYSDYFSNQAVQVCRKDNIVEDRPVNEAENKIYQELSTGQGLDKDDREYLRDNYSEDQE
ncbi:hypothetical protein [Lactobacillus delbrueckii]|uniref:hypothetical protein n=1 Tax=Lactobacillus delbrueckii TaxID=1584 RepID=UPI0012E2E746|nr:hypothetical protein [Lactobacillus delbrueckii]QGT62027.1 hypothetical protein GM421_09175 [Lactobacillus delbrueckii]